MIHIYEAGSLETTLLLLHGTGGNEHDLIKVGKAIAPGANILSVRGKVVENGMPRFFRRLQEGVFDEADLVFRTEELYHFLKVAAEKYSFDRNKIIAVGYSNGANIAGSLLFHYADALQGAILHHPMVPRRGIHLPDLSNTHVLITAGKQDPMCPAEETRELNDLLLDANAKVELVWTPAGHQFVQEEIEAARGWFYENIVL